MSVLQKFMFEGLPVRGMLVQVDAAWQEVLRRRASHAELGAYPAPVVRLLGEMTAAALLLQANIKFEGALILQIEGDGPVSLAVAEVQPNLQLRATATLQGPVPDDAGLAALVHRRGLGRCAITLDPQRKQPGKQAYQGVVPLADADGRPAKSVAEVLMHYMRQSEQLDTCLVLAANDSRAAGLLIQRLPTAGGHAQAEGLLEQSADDDHYPRIALLAQSLRPEELLQWDVQTVLHRLFWQEPLAQFGPQQGAEGPRFACRCSRERVGAMLHGLGPHELDALLRERAQVEVGCEFCGVQYRFDAVDVAQLFAPPTAVLQSPPTSQ